MEKFYKVTRGSVNTLDGLGHQAGTLIAQDGLAPDVLAALVADGTLVPVTGTDTGKLPSKEPHPEQVEQPLTKVIEPTTKKGGRR